MGLWPLFVNPLYFIPHDTHYPITEFSLDNYFNLSNPVENFKFGLPSQFVWGFEIFILRMFLNTDNYFILNIVLIIFALSLLFIFSFYSFQRITNHFFLSIVLTLCYCFTPFLATRYNTGTLYQISTCITLGLLPLFLHYLITNKFSHKNIDVYILFMIIFSYGLFYIYPLLLISVFIFLVFYLYADTNYLMITKKQAVHLIIYLLICLTVLLYAYSIYKYIITFQEIIYAYAQDKIGWRGDGSLLYPALQISAWAIYRPWNPMGIFAFKDFILSPYYFVTSSILLLCFITFAFIKRHFYLLLLFVFSCFIAKGSAEPLGEIFNTIINELPGGAMIRSPDSKFGAFIAAFFLILVCYLKNTRLFKYYLSVIVFFTVSNIYGIYYNGAIDNYFGNPKTSTYAVDPESLDIAKIIKDSKNTVVFTNLDYCYDDTYKGKFHTCRGPILSLIDKQTLFINSHNFQSNLSLFKPFNIIYLINKNLENADNIYIDSDFIKIYESDKYKLLKKISIEKECQINHAFACVEINGKFILSIPIPVFKFYYPDTQFEVTNNLVSINYQPNRLSYSKRNTLNTIYVISLLLFLSILIYRQRYI
jgi:hypothetical protein